ncbi:MAG: hypothetical protein Q8Q37_00030 [bacterium]|nr:hypothetical protein [bacterium]
MKRLCSALILVGLIAACSACAMNIGYKNTIDMGYSDSDYQSTQQNYCYPSASLTQSPSDGLIYCGRCQRYYPTIHNHPPLTRDDLLPIEEESLIYEGRKYSNYGYNPR